ncbi:MAG: hypothetical protein WC134_00300 [Acholeplasmataceae bacterium]
MLLITGVLTVIFAICAAMNMATRYTNLSLVKFIASKHRIFGVLTTLSALTHMIIAISGSNLRITGLLALVSIILTGLFGMLFSIKKEKWMFKAHRIIAPISFLFILIHVILNGSM